VSLIKEFIHKEAQKAIDDLQSQPLPNERLLPIGSLSEISSDDWDKILFALQVSGCRDLYQRFLLTRLQEESSNV
tara:strand:+ start:321 stop:545 length:225 start_codon:yes stop_codon:yes gene_type:complete